MIIDCLPKDISNICLTYLTADELIYIGKDWTKFSKSNIFQIAVRNEWMDLIEWAHINKFYELNSINWHAATYGNLKILKWALKNGCKLDDNTFACAIRNGSLDILRWLYANEPRGGSFECFYAKKYDQRHILKWLQDKRLCRCAGFYH